MIEKLIFFLIRLKLGVKKFEKFQFANQKSCYNKYYFTHDCLMKIEYAKNGSSYVRDAHVSFNWLANKDCKIKKVE